MVSDFVYCRGLYNNYVNFIMVTIIRHLFINIFQMQHFWAAKCYMGYENMSFLVIFKSPKVGKKVEKIGLAPLRTQELDSFSLVYTHLIVFLFLILSVATNMTWILKMFNVWKLTCCYRHLIRAWKWLNLKYTGNWYTLGLSNL